MYCSLRDLKPSLLLCAGEAVAPPLGERRRIVLLVILSEAVHLSTIMDDKAIRRKMKKTNSKHKQTITTTRWQR